MGNGKQKTTAQLTDALSAIAQQSIALITSRELFDAPLAQTLATTGAA